MSANACSILERHAPPHLTIEAHHVVCVAWQLFWQPPVAPSPGVDPDGRGELWDDRTVVLCPTHHRNVHSLIVALMRQAEALKVDAVPSTPFPALPVKVLRPHAPELAIARLGLSRVLAVGGSLLALTAAGEWGQS